MVACTVIGRCLGTVTPNRIRCTFWTPTGIWAGEGGAISCEFTTFERALMPQGSGSGTLSPLRILGLRLYSIQPHGFRVQGLGLGFRVCSCKRRASTQGGRGRRAARNRSQASKGFCLSLGREAWRAAEHRGDAAGVQSARARERGQTQYAGARGARRPSSARRRRRRPEYARGWGADASRKGRPEDRIPGHAR